MKALLLSFCLVAFLSCERVRDTATGAVNSGAQAVGRTASDVVNNIDKGISESLAIDIKISGGLQNAGMSAGKHYTRADQNGNQNTISIYIITDKAVNRELRAKLFDKKGVEMGRSRILIDQAAGDAAYHDFIFDPKIVFEYQSKLTIE